jgi:arylsulfatase
VTDHGPFSGIGNFDKDRWPLFHIDEDRSEAHDLADQYPKKVKELVALWFEEAKRYNVFPLIDYSVEKDLQKIMELECHIPVTPSGRCTYYLGTLEVPERSVANTHGMSYKIVAEIDETKDAYCVVFAHGSRFGGHALFIKDGKFTYCYNFLGIPPEQRVTANAPSPGKHIVGVEFTKERMGQIPRAAWSAQVVHGRQGGSRQRDSYDRFTGGTIKRVLFDVANDADVDVERHMQAALSRD